MKILLPVLAAARHEVTCLVRDARRFRRPDVLPPSQAQAQVVQGNLLQPASLAGLPYRIRCRCCWA